MKVNGTQVDGKEAWDYLTEIGHRWTKGEDKYDSDCDESYVMEASEYGFRPTGTK